MASDSPARRILAAFDRLPPQLQAAARYALDHPDDVALLSMREQARQAGVPPATMTRLSRQLGFRDYAEFRNLHAAALRRPASPPRFSEKVDMLQQRQRQAGGEALAEKVVETLTRHLSTVSGRENLRALSEAAKILEGARRVYFLGLRSCFAVAHHAAYVYGLFRDNGCLLDGAGDTGVDALRHIGPQDALLVASLAPYTAAAVARTLFAEQRGAAIIAITDSRAAPVAKPARQAILVGTETPSFFHAVSPALAAAEALIALVAARSGDKTRAAIRNSEGQLEAFAAYWSPRKPRTKP